MPIPPSEWERGAAKMQHLAAWWAETLKMFKTLVSNTAQPIEIRGAHTYDRVTLIKPSVLG